MDIICKNSSPEEIRSLISATFSYNEYMSELGAWNNSWVNVVSHMKEIIAKSNDSDLISHTTTIGDTFLEGIILASQNDRGSVSLFIIE